MTAPIDHSTIDRAVTMSPDADAGMTHAHTLAALAAGLDRVFVQAGVALGSGIDVTDRIVTALAAVEAVLDDGAACNPADGLSAVANRLSGLPQEQAVRRTTFAAAAPATTLLVTHVEDIVQTLRLLGIYAMNVKVTAMGAIDLVGILDEMGMKMNSGEADIRRFQAEIVLLSASLHRIAAAERELTAECTRALPAVPVRLGEHVAALRRYRHDAADVARRSGVLAGAIRTQAGAALGALQIGDIARQRLEHVVTGLEMLDGLAADDGVAVDAVAVAERHILSLLVDQLNDTAGEFDREAGALVIALDAIVPSAEALRALHDGDHSPGGRTFLHDLEAAVADVDLLTGRLRNADRETGAAATAIVGLVDTMVERTAMVRRLQRHVQQLAFNIDLKSRRLESNGGIIVAADYIRRVAGQLDDAATGIIGAVGTLKTIGQSAGAVDSGTIDPGAVLKASMDAIREGAIQTDRAADAAGDGATRVLGMLATTVADLRETIDAATAIRTIAAELAERAAGEPLPPPDADSPLHVLLPRIAALYSMASEREVHQRHLLPGMAIVHAEPAAGVDDDPFDDGLF